MTNELIVRYDRKNFFGSYEYIEDKKVNFSYEDVKKAFRFLKSDYKVTIVINNTVLYWSSLQNFEYGLLDAREYDDKGNYKEFNWSYEGCKNNYYSIYKNVA